MKVIKLAPYGMFGTNSYIISDDDKKAALIDAPGNTADILKALEEKGLTLEYILLTHGHCDHIKGLPEIAEKTGAKVYIHEKDAGKLKDNVQNLTEYFGLAPIVYDKPVNTVKDNDVIMLGDIGIKVMHTPGHTSGSVMYIAEDCIFSGDTLFQGSAGRTDMPDGNQCAQNHTMKNIAFREWERGDYRLYSGHGGESTLKAELEHNDFLNYFIKMKKAGFFGDDDALDGIVKTADNV
ncbi:MAG: MBL fold metallo-hydrolase [Oscillospiraceae bacterium]|nr:MBL fold metallo-hydrolase [Oscillospiraceae bacterium]